MDVNGLQQTERHPGPEEEHVVTEDHDADEETSSQDEGLSRMGVFGLHAERSLKDSGEDCYVYCLPHLFISSLISNCTVKRLSRKRRVCVYSSYHVRCVFTHSELVVDFVDVLVDPAVMQQPVEEVVPGVFDDGTTEALGQDVGPGERDGDRETHRVVLTSKTN